MFMRPAGRTVLGIILVAGTALLPLGCGHIDVYSVEGRRPMILYPEWAPAPIREKTYAYVREKDPKQYVIFPAWGADGPWYHGSDKFGRDLQEMTPEEVKAFLARQPVGIQYRPVKKLVF
jgi:hypothetical protein